MSDTIQAIETGAALAGEAASLTKEAVEAANAPAPAATMAAAVDSANSAAAPSDWFSQFMEKTEARLMQIEAAIGIGTPILGVVEGVASSLDPNAAPIIHQVDEVRGVVTDLLGALTGAFGSKIALPAAPTGQTPPPAA